MQDDSLFELYRSDDTKEVVELFDKVVDIATTRIANRNVIRLTITDGDRLISTYIDHNGTVEHDVGSVVDSPWLHEAASAECMERAVTDALAIPGSQNVMFEPFADGYQPTIQLMVPGVGNVEFELANLPDDWTLEKAVKKIRRHRLQDAEARTISRLGAMSFALAAADEEDLDRIVDTIFVAGTITYRGISCEIAKGDRLVTCFSAAGARIRADGIEIGELPDTIKLALRGDAYKDKPLASLVDIAGFENLRIAQIDGRAAANRRVLGGAGWIRIDVRDVDGAKLDDLEKEEAREIAHETFQRRCAAQAA